MSGDGADRNDLQRFSEDRQGEHALSGKDGAAGITSQKTRCV
jgi:hypothetical protein